MKKSLLGMSLALILALTTVFPAFAEEVTVSGVVSGLDPVTCSFTLTTETAEVFAVTSPEGTDCSSLADGATVEVTGESDGEGNIAASSVVVLSTDDEEEEGVNTGFHCSNPDATHPALGMLAEAYEADYASLLDWFCQGGLGVGGIMLALRTAEQTGGSAEEIIAMRQEGGGWGQIWQNLGLIGPNRGGDDGEEGEEIEADGENGGPGNGNGGKPPWAGGGKPPWAGGGKPPWAGGGNN